MTITEFKLRLIVDTDMTITEFKFL